MSVDHDGHDVDHEARDGGFSPYDEPDAGLLDPVRVGSAAEAATGETAVLQALLDAEAALTRAQAALGLAPAEAARAVTEAARADRFDARELALRGRGGGNPVIPLVVALTAAVPDAHAPYVHRGATSQDILDTALMLVAHRTTGLVVADLEVAAGALARMAGEHRDTPVAGRTLTQHAVPTTFGLKVAGWRSLALDARDRLLAVRGTLPAQLGGSAGTLAAFHADAQVAGAAPPADALRLLDAYAREVALAAPELPWHGLRTPVADLAGALAFTAGALGKLAADVLLLSRTEVGEVSEGTGGGSSAMPHKANPVRATLVAAAARRAPGLASVLYGCIAAVDERPAGAWHAEWETLRDLLRLVGGAARDAAELVVGLDVHPARMRTNLDLTNGMVVSERLAVVLAARLGRPRARQLLTEAAHTVRAGGGGLADALAGEPALTDLDLVSLADPTGYTGAAAALTDRALRRR
ncbi:3-carboxy-cis,cis-muconate cycloisomerase [Streptomyces noursei]|uniref:3-carboxy-cis,cis-muconate cycloisomerase n=1 Tax=Streptomyces noursei TaxID=1971 RepID=UPI0023B804E9|nr:3-carboxy-cis,cis-muconate cycloisomerase [Streptomyces noursei]